MLEADAHIMGPMSHAHHGHRVIALLASVPVEVETDELDRIAVLLSEARDSTRSSDLCSNSSHRA